MRAQLFRLGGCESDDAWRRATKSQIVFLSQTCEVCTCSYAFKHTPLKGWDPSAHILQYSKLLIPFKGSKYGQTYINLLFRFEAYQVCQRCSACRDPRSRFEVCQLPKGLGGSGSWSSGRHGDGAKVYHTMAYICFTLNQNRITKSPSPFVSV